MLGIDVSKNTLDCSLIDPATQKRLWHKRFRNNPEGIAELLRDVAPSEPMVLEPTGRYGLPVVLEARQTGRTVFSAPPRKAKAFLASIQDRAKTDKVDSRDLARFATATTLYAYPVAEPHVQKLNDLLSARAKLSKTLTMLRQQAADIPAIKDIHQPAIDALAKQVEEATRQIAALTTEHKGFEAVRELDKVPGVGPLIAAALAACLEFKRFEHPDQFVAHLGLDVRVRQSGKKRGTRGLTKQGDAELRRLLYCAAVANLRCKSSPFKDQYERERAKGLKPTAALCSVSRKLAKVCWSLHKYKTSYDEARVAKQPAHEPRQQTEEQANEA